MFLLRLVQTSGLKNNSRQCKGASVVVHETLTCEVNGIAQCQWKRFSLVMPSNQPGMDTRSSNPPSLGLNTQFFCRNSVRPQTPGITLSFID